MTIENRSEGDGPLDPSSISTTLLERVRAKRPEAWQRLIDLYGPVVYRWCRRLGVSQADVADVVQDVFVSVAADVGRFRRDQPGDSFGAWLRTITRHRVYDHFRRRQGMDEAHGGTTAYEILLAQAESIDDSSLVSSVENDAKFNHRLLESIKAEFEIRTWEVFWRIAVDGQLPADVAKELGLSLPAIYQAKSRVLRRLRQELEGLDGG